MAKNKSSRCPCFKKKLGLITFKCKCDITYCMTCKMPEVHKCTYDFKAKEKLKLEKENPVITFNKVIEI